MRMKNSSIEIKMKAFCNFQYPCHLFLLFLLLRFVPRATNLYKYHFIYFIKQWWIGCQVQISHDLKTSKENHLFGPKLRKNVPLVLISKIWKSFTFSTFKLLYKSWPTTTKICLLIYISCTSRWLVIKLVHREEMPGMGNKSHLD